MAVTRVRVAVTTLRMLLAAVFIVSSVAKFLAIDDFELYIYSYGFFSLNLTYLIARLCIVAELLTGLMLALGWWKRTVWLLTLAMLLFFSLFLCYAALAGRTESCQCFGRMADLGPVPSLLKNAVLILLALLYGHWSRKTAGVEPKKKATRGWITAGLGVATLATVFCVSVPDNWMFGSEELRYDHEAFNHAIGTDGALAADSLTTGTHIIAFVTPGCPYCRMSREKLGSIAKRNHLDTTFIHYYEPNDLPEDLFLQITHGLRPLILLIHDGHTEATFHYRNIDERLIARTLR